MTDRPAAPRPPLPGFEPLEGRLTAAVLDAARLPGLPEALVARGARPSCLYDGDSAAELADVAPYLIALSTGSALNRWLFSEVWGQSAGVLLESRVELPELRSHLRRLLMVFDASFELLYFRMYDPRVLRQFLPTCDAAQLEQMFGPVEAYLVEGEDPGTAMRFSVDRGELVTEAIGLAASSRPPRPKIEWKG